MILPTSVMVLLIAALAIWAVVDFMIAGTSISRTFYRGLRSMALGTIEIDTPPDLGLAAVNGLLGVGSVIVAGDEAEWDGHNVVVYAISPKIVHAPQGSRFQVVKVSPRKMELRLIKSLTGNEDRPKK